MLVVTSRFEVVKVEVSRTREVIKMETLGTLSGPMKIDEKEMVPETMVHKGLTDYMINIGVLKRWLSMSEETMKDWEVMSKRNPTLRSKLAMRGKEVHKGKLGSLDFSCPVPVRLHRSSCFECNAPLSLYRVTVTSIDTVEWELDTPSGIEKISSNRGWCSPCIVVRSLRRQVEDHMSSPENHGMRSDLASKERARVMEEKRLKFMTDWNAKEKRRWGELVQKSRDSFFGKEK
tara:strand:+ start:156 stop:854 length:699 start_codon:yes stop_codon:yes gene_type:complete